MGEGEDEEKNVFHGTLEDVSAVDVDAILLSSCKADYFEIESWLVQRATEAQEAGDQENSEVLRLIAAFCGLNCRYDNPDEPFGPMFTTGDKRSFIPQDLSISDREVLCYLANKVRWPLLAARLNDLVWYLRAAGRTSHTYARAAIASYIEIARMFRDEEDHWFEGLDALKRAFLLSKSLNDHTEIKQCESEFNSYLEKSFTLPLYGYLARILDTYRAFRLKIGPQAAETAESISDRIASTNDGYLAKDTFLSLSEIYCRDNDDSGERRCVRKAALALYQYAEYRATGNVPSLLAAAGILQEAIILLQRINPTKEELESWKNRLRDYETRSVKEYVGFSVPIDLKEPIQAAVRHVSGYDFRTAVLRFAYGHPLVDIERLKQGILESRKQSSLANLISATITEGSTGRVLAKSPPLDELDGTGMYKQLISEACKFEWSMRLRSFIQPAWSALYYEHHPTYEDICPIVSASPFVPEGHEEIFLHGLTAGFNGDFFVSTSLLCPQIENSLRFLLEQNNVTPRTINPDGTEEYWLLDKLLNDRKLHELLGEQMIFELDGHLRMEGWGYNIRHQTAHGFLTHDGFFSVGAISLWWLVLRLCIHPYRIEKTEG